MRKRERRIVLGLLIAGLIAAGSWGVSRIVRLRPSEIGQRPTPEVRLTGESSAEETDTRALTADEPGEGIGRNSEYKGACMHRYTS